MAKNTKTEKLELVPANESKNALTMFAAPGSIDVSKFKRLNMPGMVKPGDVPVGAMVIGILMGVFKSPVSTIKGNLLHLKLESGQEITFPATGVIRNALAPGVTGEDEIKKELEKFTGKTLVLVRNGDKQSQKYKKNMFMFDVFVK